MFICMHKCKSGTYSGHLADCLTGLGAKTLAQKKKKTKKNAFQVFFCQFYFNEKYVEVVINNFTMHLIISK